MFLMEQKLFLEHDYGIELSCVAFMAVYSRVWPCMIFLNLVWCLACLVVLYGYIIGSTLYHLFSWSLVIDPNTFGLF